MKKRWLGSVSLPVDLGEIADKYIDDFSGYVQECIRRDFNIDYLSKLNEVDLKKIEDRKKIIEELKKENKVPKEKENTEKEKFFKEAKKAIEKDPSFLMGQFEKYKNIFKEKISLEKFKEIIK